MINIKKVLGENRNNAFDIIVTSVKNEQHLFSAINLLESIFDHSEIGEDWKMKILKQLSRFDFIPTNNVWADIGVDDAYFIEAKITGYKNEQVVVNEINTDNDFELDFHSIRFTNPQQ